MKRSWETMISEEEDQGRKRMNREEDEDEGFRLPCCSVFMRVLLVEFDDCTRQIIAALLRKCGYKVVAVHDGEKAWDVLKEKPHNFDLVMTEMTLPMLSGYDLLSLVMEHPICRKIPVIMMSSQDSISLVFKCMIKGAADFLAKPIRKNELRNLWQHVWRRNSSVEVGSGCQSENRMQENVKAVSDDQNATSNHSSHYPGGVLRGRDEQSSCTKPAMEIEGEIMDLAEEVTQPQGASTPSPSAEQELKKDEDIADMDQECTAKESEPHDSDTLLETSSNFEADVWNSKSYDPHKEAVDLLGAIDRRYRVIAEPSVHEKESNSKFVSFPLWELSLTSPHLDISINQRMEEKHKLNHSNASAFSRYNNKAISDKHRMEVDNSRNSCHPSFVEMQGNSTQHAVFSATPRKCDASKWQTSFPDSNYDFAANPAFHCHQMGLFPVPIPIKNLYGMNAGFGTLLQPIIYPRTGSLWKPTSVTQSECSENKNHFQQDQDYFQDRDTNPSTCHSQSRETSVASAEEQKGCSTSCRSRSSLQEQDGRKSCTDVIGQRSSSNADDDSLTPAVVVTAVPADVPIDIRHVASAGQMASENQSSQREAALTKFRMKRKDRCFEKKVRYQSRKTLAEQRPRVKGQFVRQVYPGSTASQLVN